MLAASKHIMLLMCARVRVCVCAGYVEMYKIWNTENSRQKSEGIHKEDERIMFVCCI